MNLLVRCAAALLVSSAAMLVSGQTPIQPGQLATAAKLQIGEPGDVTANASNAMPRVSIAATENPHDAFMNRLWMASIFADIAGTSLDAATSWGKREGNSLLASSDGTFGAKGVSIKAAFAAAILVPQLCLRKHDELKRVFAVGNFAEAAFFAGIAVHNSRIHPAAAVQ